MSGPRSAVGAPGPGSRGFAEARLGKQKLVAVFGVAFALAVGGAALAIGRSGPDDASADCPTGPPCTDPPVEPAGLVTGTLWRSSDLGFQVEYDERIWSRTGEDARSLTLEPQTPSIDVALVIGGVESEEASPEALLDDRLERLGRDLVSVAPDDDPAHRIFGPSVGYIDGVGGAYVGVTESPQGPGRPVAIVVMAAGDGEVSAFTALVTTEADEVLRDQIYQEVDSVLNTFRFPGELVG